MTGVSNKMANSTEAFVIVYSAFQRQRALLSKHLQTKCFLFQRPVPDPEYDADRRS
jgi:hypothetical protein